jgi:hypothetical protein
MPNLRTTGGNKIWGTINYIFLCNFGRMGFLLLASPVGIPMENPVKREFYTAALAR